MTTLREALKAEDDAAVTAAMQAVNALSQRTSEAIYRSAESATADGADGAIASDEDIVDAEVVDEGEDQAAAG